ncbi:MAG: histidinol-phosphate transaminase [Haliscomenobacter sp.]|uniref:histidinol-phosphate transaminase n=1 Tax=Haliscomenobacter sp. TaxID=2717303 RepID=UPI0029BB20C8|nr:histidinol-phosphate transaminase [Haliscomenobacter sp.]MDX2069048.1 histidinol-phosphate transaminase [Haliscomenobacter sp.]
MEIANLVRPNIRKLVPYSSARSEFKGKAEVFLDANENPFETGLNRYPDPLQWKLKAAISQLKGVPAEQIFLGNGSDEAIDLVVRIFCEPRQDHILILPPTYGMYQVSADIADVGIRTVSLTPDFQPDVEAILAAADEQSKILFICSPNNPTGNDVELERIRSLCAQFKGVVVVDEAYIDFSNQASCTSLLPEFPNLIVLQTFSKAWGMAGIRLGMAFASPEIIQLFNKVKPPYNINQLTQQIALEALETSQDDYRQILSTLLSERERLVRGLGELKFVEKIFPSDANFILVKMDDPNGTYQFLVEEGIIVRNRNSVHLCAGSLRITVGRPEENDALLTALNKRP